MASSINKQTYLHSLNLFFIGYVIVTEGLRSTIFKYDIAQRTTLILLIIVIAANLMQRIAWRKTGAIAIYAWVAWTIYVVIMKLYYGINSKTNTPMDVWIWTKLFLPCSVLVISYFECIKNTNKIIKIAVYGLAFNLLLIVIFGTSKFDAEGGMGNEQPLKAFVFLAFLCLARYYKIVNKVVFFLGLILALGVTFWIATRKALAADAIILVGYFYSSRKLSFKTAIVTIILLVFAYWCYDFILNNTFIGERIEAGAEADNSKWNPSGNWFLNLMQDRAYFYVVGWEYFLDRPFFGIGINNFTYYTGIPELPIHSEYMVQICECGIIGCVFYFTFLFSMLYGILRTPFLRGVYLIVGACFLSILWLSFTAWIYDGVFYMMLYATIIAIPKLYMRKNRVYGQIR